MLRRGFGNCVGKISKTKRDNYLTAKGWHKTLPANFVVIEKCEEIQVWEESKASEKV